MFSAALFSKEDGPIAGNPAPGWSGFVQGFDHK